MSNVRIDGQAIEEHAEVFKALSNPNRLRIYLQLASCLSGGAECQARDDEVDAYQRKLAESMGLAPSTVSHHIKELKNAGLILLRRAGRNVSITINAERLEQLNEVLGAIALGGSVEP